MGGLVTEGMPLQSLNISFPSCFQQAIFFPSIKSHFVKTLPNLYCSWVRLEWSGVYPETPSISVWDLGNGGYIKQILWPMIGGRFSFELFNSIQLDSLTSKGRSARNK